MKWFLHTTDVPIRKVIQHIYPRIRDHELVMKPKTIPLEQTQLPESHYSTVYPPPITMDPRLFASPTRTNTQYQEETEKLRDELLQQNKEATPSTTPTPSQTFDDLSKCMAEWLTLDSIGRCDPVEELCTMDEGC